jgi:hypothetical protein
MKLQSGDGYLEIEVNKYEELILDNRNITLWTNGYEEHLEMTVEELDSLIEQLIEFRKGIK